jgi:hypothetical protein
MTPVFPPPMPIVWNYRYTNHHKKEEMIMTKEKKMTPEPLKEKLQTSYMIGFDYDDIKSAVEGYLEEVLKEIESYERDKVKSIFKKWFEDVI